MSCASLSLHAAVVEHSCFFQRLLSPFSVSARADTSALAFALWACPATHEHLLSETYMELKPAMRQACCLKLAEPTTRPKCNQSLAGDFKPSLGSIPIGGSHDMHSSSCGAVELFLPS